MTSFLEHLSLHTEQVLSSICSVGQTLVKLPSSQVFEYKCVYKWVLGGTISIYNQQHIQVSILYFTHFQLSFLALILQIKAWSFQFFPFVKTQGHSYLRRMQCPFSIRHEVLPDVNCQLRGFDDDVDVFSQMISPIHVLHSTDQIVHHLHKTLHCDNDKLTPYLVGIVSVSQPSCNISLFHLL